MRTIKHIFTIASLVLIPVLSAAQDTASFYQLDAATSQPMTGQVTVVQADSTVRMTITLFNQYIIDSIAVARDSINDLSERSILNSDSLYTQRTDQNAIIGIEQLPGLPVTTSASPDDILGIDHVGFQRSVTKDVLQKGLRDSLVSALARIQVLEDGGSGIWTESNGKISPTTSGYDILLTDATERLVFGDEDAFIYEISDDNLSFVTAGATRMIIGTEVIYIYSNIQPSANHTYSSGQEGNHWKEIYTDTIYIDYDDPAVKSKIYTDGSNNLVLHDAVTGAKTIGELVANEGDSVMVLWEAVFEDTTDIADIAPIFTDTNTIFVFGGGGANTGDTVSFTTSTIYGSFRNSGSDTLVITEINAVLQTATLAPILEIDIMWNTSFSTGSATHLLTADFPINTTATGTSVFYSEVAFNENKIPPGVRVWCKTPVLTHKPAYMEITMSGYKINGN